MYDAPPPPQTALRPPSEVMRLCRMGAAFPTRLSFMPTLLRRMAAEKTRLSRPVWALNPAGFGHALYTLTLGGHPYSLIAVSTDLPADQRTDRVIASAWDTSYVLYDGVADGPALARIVATAPLQEAARFTDRDLILSRANKSVRLFDHVTARLRQGAQPDPMLIRDTGYLMRTTAVYGNGKFGIADRDQFAHRPGLQGPFMAEMLTVWLIRNFTHDLAEHVGQGRLARGTKRFLGIGNATGLGMAPFLVSHPLLLDVWMQVRETALARVRAIPVLTPDQVQQIYDLTARTAQHLAEWQVADPVAAARLHTLRHEWPQVAASLSPEALNRPRPLDRLIHHSTTWSIDTQELLIAMLLEPFGDLIDGLTDCMASPHAPRLDAAMPCKALSALITRDWTWALTFDFTSKSETARFWYVSEEKLEPRMGNRHDEPGADREAPLDTARQVQALAKAMQGQTGPLARFLARNPEHRAAARRVQTLDRHPYAEIRDNLIGQDCLPVDMLRCKLAFFGAARFDPKSDRWTRITLAQGAPLADELGQTPAHWLATAPG